MTPEERIANGEQAKHAMAQFLAPAFDVVTEAYSARFMELAAESPISGQPAMVKLAMALKIVKTVRDQIEAVARDGDFARHDIKHAAQIEALSPERRKLLGIFTAASHG